MSEQVRGIERALKPALLINECQMGVIGLGRTMFPDLARQVEARGIIPRIARLVAAFRKAKLPVLHSHVAHRADFGAYPTNTLIAAVSKKHGGMIEGSADVLPPPELAPDSSDFIIRRNSGLSSFYDTTLDSTLRNLGVKTLVPVGVSTIIAMPGITLHAVDRGYNVVIPEDCLAAPSQEVHDFIIREQLRLLATITTSAALQDALGAQFS